MRKKATVYFIVLAALLVSCGSTSDGSNTANLPNDTGIPSTADIRNTQEVALFDYDDVYAARDEHEHTIVDYAEAIRRGNTHRARGDLELAIAYFTEAIRLDPSSALAFNNRGNLNILLTVQLLPMRALITVF